MQNNSPLAKGQEFKRLPVTDVIRFMLEFFKGSEHDFVGLTNKIMSIKELPDMKPYTWVVSYSRHIPNSRIYRYDVVVIQVDAYHINKCYLTFPHQREIPLTEDEKQGKFSKYTGLPVGG